MEVKLVSKVPADPIQPVEEWAWGKIANGLVYFATQTWGGILGKLGTFLFFLFVVIQA